MAEWGVNNFHTIGFSVLTLHSANHTDEKKFPSVAHFGRRVRTSGAKKVTRRDPENLATTNAAEWGVNTSGGVRC